MVFPTAAARSRRTALSTSGSSGIESRLLRLTSTSGVRPSCTRGFFDSISKHATPAGTRCALARRAPNVGRRAGAQHDRRRDQDRRRNSDRLAHGARRGARVRTRHVEQRDRDRARRRRGARARRRSSVRSRQVRDTRRARHRRLLVDLVLRAAATKASPRSPRSDRPVTSRTLDVGVIVATLVVNVFVVWYERRRGRELGSAFLLADAAHTSSDILVTLDGARVAGVLALGWRVARRPSSRSASR